MNSAHTEFQEFNPQIYMESTLTSTVFRSWAPEPGYHFGADECPWIETGPKSWAKFMHLNLRNNSVAILFKLNPGGSLAPHYHTMPVVGYVIQGTWKYKEYDWIASRGSTVYEPPGEVHTLLNIGSEPMICFFHVTGPEVGVDEAGHPTSYTDTNTYAEFLREYCKKENIDDSFMKKITR